MPHSHPHVHRLGHRRHLRCRLSGARGESIPETARLAISNRSIRASNLRCVKSLAGQFTIRIDHIHCLLCVVSSEFVSEAEIGGATAEYINSAYSGFLPSISIASKT